MDSDQLTELILALQMIKGVGPKTVLKFFDTVKPHASQFNDQSANQ